MAETNLTNLAGAFKRNYNAGSDVMIAQQNLNSPFWTKIKKSDLKPSAAGVFSPVMMEGNESGGAIFENEGFKAPDSAKPVQPQIFSKTVVWPFEVTGKSIRLSQGDKIAFGTALDIQQKDNLSRITSDLNRQSNGTGTGQITLANGAGVNSATLVVDNIFPFRKGMYIDLFATLGGIKEVDGVKISSVDPTTSTITLAGGAIHNWSDNAIICKRGVMDGTSPGNYKEVMGVLGLVDTTTYSTTFEGLAVSTYPDWIGNVVSAGNAPVSQDLLQKTAIRVSVIGGEEPDVMKSNHGQARNFLNTELVKTRYEGGEVKAGNTVLKWGKYEWMVDHTYQPGEVAFLNTKRIEKFECKDIGLSDLGGGALFQIPRSDNIGGYYSYEGEIGTWKRNSHARLTDLTEPAF